LKNISIFLLLVYWSFIIIAPVIDKNDVNLNNKTLILPLKKPLN
tara:strand:+ start:1182 stop:1313 length:132 start_codon:yes stop_codon:yes gene_type:complete